MYNLLFQLSNFSDSLRTYIYNSSSNFSSQVCCSRMMFEKSSITTIFCLMPTFPWTKSTRCCNNTQTTIKCTANKLSVCSANRSYEDFSINIIHSNNNKINDIILTTESADKTNEGITARANVNANKTSTSTYNNFAMVYSIYSFATQCIKNHWKLIT